METAATVQLAVEMHKNLGPVVGGQMLHVWIDFLAFAFSMYLIVKIGTGKIRYPIFLFSLGFFVAALTSLAWGHDLMWLGALLKSIIGLLAMVWFLQIFGFFQSRKT